MPPILDCIKFAVLFLLTILAFPALIWFFQAAKEDGHPVQLFLKQWILKWRIKIGSIAGFPVFLHFSILIWAIYWMVEGVKNYHGILFIAFLWASILLHEFSHAISCRLLGMGTGSITLWFYGGFFIPLSIEKTAFQLDEKRRKKYILIVMAGPMSNMILSGIAYLISFVLTSELFLAVAEMNLFLAMLNLFPIPQLDGGQILYVFLVKYYKWQSMYRIVGVLLIILAAISLFAPLIVENYPVLLANFAFVILAGGIYALRMSGKADDEIEMAYQNAINREKEFVYGDTQNAV